MRFGKFCFLLGCLLSLAGVKIPSADACLPVLIPVVGAIAGAFTGGRLTKDNNNARPASRLLGCFSDGPNNRDLGPIKKKDDKMSLMVCADECRKGSFQFAGLQNSTDCYCSNFYGKYGEVSMSRCSFACKGKTSESCGGYYANAVYKLGVAAR